MSTFQLFQSATQSSQLFIIKKIHNDDISRDNYNRKYQWKQLYIKYISQMERS